MKNIDLELDDSLRREYHRSDFGELIRGKFGMTQVDLVDLTSILLACIGENEGIEFKFNNAVPGHWRHGDWTFSFDDKNEITLSYWIWEFESIEEKISNPPCISTAIERSELHSRLLEGVKALKERVSESAQ